MKPEQENRETPSPKKTSPKKTSKKKSNDATEEKTFEQAMARLEEIVALLDSGELPLEQSLQLFSEGAALVGVCNNQLEKATLTIEKLFPSAPEAQEADDDTL